MPGHGIFSETSDGVVHRRPHRLFAKNPLNVGHGILGGTSDGAVHRRPHRLFAKNPPDVQFERQVARPESRQQQWRERKTYVLLAAPPHLPVFLIIAATENPRTITMPNKHAQLVAQACSSLL